MQEQCPTSDRNPVSTLWLTDEVTYDLTVTVNIFRGKKLREHHFNTRYRALRGWWDFGLGNHNWWTRNELCSSKHMVDSAGEDLGLYLSSAICPLLDPGKAI